jgi:hypothetical protein
VANKVAQPVNGQAVGATYSGDSGVLPWLKAHGYVYDDANSTDLADSTDVADDDDPTLAVNREDPGDTFQFGTDAELAPRVESISPATGPAAGGTAIVITGDNMTGVTSVTVGGVATTAFSVVSDNEVHATTGAHAAGAADVAVVKSAGPDTTVTGGFTYTA